MLHTQGVVKQHVVDGGVGFLKRGGHDHALARGQTIGFDNDGCPMLIHIGMGQACVFESLVIGGRDAMTLHEGFGKRLGTFKLSGCSGGAKDAQTVGPEFIDHPCRQRCFRTHHGQANIVVLRPFTQGHDVGEVHHLKVFISGHTCIAWGHVDHLHLRRLGQFPSQSVFAAARTNDQHFHSAALW